MLSFFLTLLILFLLGLMCFMAAQLFNLLFRGYAPYFTTRKPILDKILAEVKLDESSVVYELGAGEAPLLKALEHKYPVGELIGVEYALLPWFLGKMQLIILGSRIKLRKINLFRLHLSSATHIYCYLNSEMMEKLEGKFERECKAGTIIISYKFPLPQLQPKKIVQYKKKEIFIYKI